MDTTRIRNLNDTLRQNLVGRVMLTRSVADLPGADRMAILHKVRTFDKWDEDNDPYGEHDFGAIEHNGQKFFFKIDYYDRTLTSGSEDPSDPTKTARVLTIMHASDY